MSTFEIILWVLAFAVVTMIIYGWGLVKSSRQQDDLLAIFIVKGRPRSAGRLKRKVP